MVPGIFIVFPLIVSYDQMVNYLLIYFKMINVDLCFFLIAVTGSLDGPEGRWRNHEKMLSKMQDAGEKLPAIRERDKGDLPRHQASQAENVQHAG